jgi:hypothetical protein
VAGCGGEIAKGIVCPVVIVAVGGGVGERLEPVDSVGQRFESDLRVSDDGVWPSMRKSHSLSNITTVSIGFLLFGPPLLPAVRIRAYPARLPA